MMDVPAEHLIAAIHVETGDAVLLWLGAGAVANEQGDLYGTSAQRIIHAGKAVIASERLDAAIAAGWCLVRIGEDPDFAWIERG